MMKQFPNFSKADDESVIDILAFEYDNFKTGDSTVADQWLRFKVIIQDCVQRFIPSTSNKV